jgi:WD40 repeat protein
MRNARTLSFLLLLCALGTGTAKTPPASKDQTAPKRDLYCDPLPEGAIARMGALRLRGGFGALAFSPDGQTVLATDHLSIRRWGITDGKPLARTPLQWETKGRPPLLSACVLTRDGKTLAGRAVAQDRFGPLLPQGLYVWDTATGKQRCRITVERGFLRDFVALSDDGKLLAAPHRAGAEEPIRLWDARTGAELRQLNSHDPSIFNLLFSPDGNTLASTSYNHSIRLWKTETGEQLHNLHALDSSAPSLVALLTPMAFSADGKRFVTSDGAQTVEIWNVQSGKQLTRLNASVTGDIEALEFSPDGKTLAVKGEHALALWDVASQKLLRQWPVLSTSRSPMRFSPDGKILASTLAGNVLLWDCQSGKPLHDWPGHRDFLTWIGVSPDGKSLLSIAARVEGKLDTWDIETGRLRQSLPLGVENRLGFTRSSNGIYVASGGVDRTLTVWQLPEGKAIRQVAIESPASDLSKPMVRFLQLSADGAQLAAVARRHEAPNRFSTSLLAWDLGTGKQLVNRRLPLVEAGRFNFAFAPDGQTLVIPREEGLLLQDVLTGQERLILRGHLGAPVSFSADGQIMAAGMYQLRDPAQRQRMPRNRYQIEEIGLWELATGQLIRRVKTGPFSPIAFAPGGQLLATAGKEALILWDIASGKAVYLRPLEAVNMGIQVSSIREFDFTPDGRYLATGMLDGTILVWDAAAATPPSQAPRVVPKKELEQAWTDLGGDASVAWPAMGLLTEAAPQTLALFQERLRPAVDAPAKRLRQLLSDLDSTDFNVRDAASRELEKLGELAAPKLRRALEDKPALEKRQRIDTLLVSLRLLHQPEALRRLRAVRVLEQIGTPQARKLLEMMSKGSRDARETAAAVAARDRLLSHDH